MSCNMPLLAVPVQGLVTKNGKPKYVPLCRYDRNKEFDYAKLYPDYIKIPCGQCFGCRAQKSREWADRMILELDHSKTAVFCTLTYNDEHLPLMYDPYTGQTQSTLIRRHLSLFLKRLRKRFSEKEIRFYAVGEYGPKSQRCHFHLILFGLQLSDFPDLRQHGFNSLGQQYFVSDFLSQKIWKQGFCLLSDVSWNTCAYVARYVRKKLTGSFDKWVDSVREPEFSVMSRNPGIGMFFPIDHPDYADFSKFFFPGQEKAVEVVFPSIFLSKLEKDDPVRFEQLKADRALHVRNAEFAKINQTDLSIAELCELDEDQLIESSELLDFYRAL